MAWRYPRYIAHRGGGALAPENTLVGIRLAARLGYSAVEFDVMLSADGIPVLSHDATLDRTTNGQGLVADTTLQQLQRLDAGLRQHRAYAGEPIATLEQALNTCQALGLSANIEIKPGAGQDVETGRCVAKLARSWNTRGAALLISSFSEAALLAARELTVELPRALLVEAIPPDWQARMRHADCIALHCGASQFEVARAEELIACGVPLACYTVNQPADAIPLFAASVSAIFTDRLDLFDPRR